MIVMAIIELLARIIKEIGPDILDAIKNDIPQEEIEKRVTKKIRILKPEIDALRRRKSEIDDFIKNG